VGGKFDLAGKMSDRLLALAEAQDVGGEPIGSSLHALGSLAAQHHHKSIASILTSILTPRQCID
jgi:hypothetical protein